MNPFRSSFSPSSQDQELIKKALDGSAQALEQLIKSHQDYIYNVVLKLVLNPEEAEDLTQEVLIKMVTKLAQFKGRSSFRTWLYRIAFNHFLKMKKTQFEGVIHSFDEYQVSLNQIQDHELTQDEKIAQQELIEEAKLSCMSGMLMCLDRPQRLVYILGEIFEVDHQLGSELMDISTSNFRKKLERARRDLYRFMNHQCGLVNPANPCRCARKTKGFIESGWVDPQNMRYNTHFTQSISQSLADKNQQLDHLLEHEYAAWFQSTPFQEKDHSGRLMKGLLQDPFFRDTFNLGS